MCKKNCTFAAVFEKKIFFESLNFESLNFEF